MATPATQIRESLGRSGRLARLSSRALERSEQSIDGQIGLRAIRAAVRKAIAANRTERERDKLTDRQRVLKYKALAQAIDTGDPKVGRAALVEVATHEFADEYLEDKHRDGEIVAGERLEANIAALHDTLHALTPELVEGIAPVTRA